MNIIKSISAMITKFWRWITETAWVQPLLIVGGIFAVIFSIPKFTTWFEAMGVNSSNSFYTNYRVSLEGEGREENGTRIMTDADKLTAVIDKWSFTNTQYDSYETYRKNVEADDGLRYGEKFFMVFYKSDCSGCEEAKNGFETLITGWNTSFPIAGSQPFKLYSIQADQTSSNDDTYEIDTDKKAINRYLTYFEAADLWASAAGRLEDAPYRTNASAGMTNYTYIENTDLTNWPVPTIFLIDFTKEAYEAGRPGLSEVLFGVSGSSYFENAQLLANMWNHLDAATASSNPFNSAYKK